MRPVNHRCLLVIAAAQLFLVILGAAKVQPIGPIGAILDDYGAEALQWAVRTALDRETPRVSSVAFLLNQRRRSSQIRAPRPVTLDRRPDLADLHVQPHHPEIYDELSNRNKN